MPRWGKGRITEHRRVKSHGMKIIDIQAAGLRGATPEGGWANEIKPDDCVHTLIAVFTDEGVTGWGSSFTNDRLVQASLDILEPLYIGENPSRTRTSQRETPRAHVLARPRRSPHPHNQRH